MYSLRSFYELDLWDSRNINEKRITHVVESFFGSGTAKLSSMLVENSITCINVTIDLRERVQLG